MNEQLLQFDFLLNEAASGRVEGIVMHVDTLRLLGDAEWLRLRDSGLSVAVFHKQDGPVVDTNQLRIREKPSGRGEI